MNTTTAIILKQVWLHVSWPTGLIFSNIACSHIRYVITWHMEIKSHHIIVGKGAKTSEHFRDPEGGLWRGQSCPAAGSQEAYVPAFLVITGNKEPLPQTRLVSECLFVWQYTHAKVSWTISSHYAVVVSVVCIELAAWIQTDWDHMIRYDQFEEPQRVCVHWMWLYVRQRWRESERIYLNPFSDMEYVTCHASITAGKVKWYKYRGVFSHRPTLRQQQRIIAPILLAFFVYVWGI